MIKNFKVIKNELGNIIKIFNKVDIKLINEVYISEVNYKITKGWNFHKKATCKIFIIEGEIKFYLTKNFKTYREVSLSSKDYKLFIIKPKIWFKFKGLKRKNKLINFINYSYDKNEIKKKNIN